MKRRGRPMKYFEFFRVLEMDKLYAPSSVMRAGEENGLFELEEFQDSHIRYKVRMAMNRFAGDHFLGEGDAVIEQKGRAPMRGWYGWRWKDAIPRQYFSSSELAQIQTRKARMAPASVPSSAGSEAGAVQAVRTHWQRWIRKPVLVFSLVILGSFGAFGMMSAFYPEGFRVFREQGPRAALEYFQRASNKSENPTLVFGQAWSKYSMGDLKEAEEDCYRLIREPNLPEGIYANALFLLGNIARSNGRYDEADEHLYQAYSIYERLGKDGNLYKSCLAMARVAIMRGDLERAESLLDQSLVHHAFVQKDLGHYFQLKTQAAFLRGDYGDALDFSYQRLAEYERVGMKNNQADALSDIGFYSILMGYYNHGFDKTIQAQEFIQKTGAQGKYYFNLINFLLLQRCKGGTYQTLVDQIQKRIDEEANLDLKSYLEFSMTCDCAREREGEPPIGESLPEKVGEGDDTPPDGP